MEISGVDNLRHLLIDTVLAVIAQIFLLFVLSWNKVVIIVCIILDILLLIAGFIDWLYFSRKIILDAYGCTFVSSRATIKKDRGRFCVLSYRKNNSIVRRTIMKKRFLKFLSKYWFCFLLSITMVLGISLSTRYADLYESGSGMIRFDLFELYLIFVIPLYSFIYGCLSYAILKKVWFPQLIIFAITFLYWFRYGIDAFVWEGTYIWSAYPVIFSLIGTAITAFIYYIIKSINRTGDGTVC